MCPRNCRKRHAVYKNTNPNRTHANEFVALVKSAFGEKYEMKSGLAYEREMRGRSKSEDMPITETIKVSE